MTHQKVDFCYSIKVNEWVIGIDEVGRGPVAGPVYVCAAALPRKVYEHMQLKGLTDSKMLTEKSREKWYKEAVRLEAEGILRIGIKSASAAHIDTYGIMSSIRTCVDEALRSLLLLPDTCTVYLDGGLHAPEEYKVQHTVIKGDRIHKIISLASVIAKVTRDHHMQDLHKIHPKYGWYRNKGYGTKEHMSHIYKAGITSEHRKTFLKNILDK